jgi:hypothetical protein
LLTCYAAYGLTRFRAIAADYEVSSPSPYVPTRDIMNRLPAKLKTDQYIHRWQKRLGAFGRGNFVDMAARRKRAYELARSYAAIHKFEWDLIFFVRLDLAFYDPVLDFYSIYRYMKQFSELNAGLSKPLFIPGACNFGGACDRIAMGLPNAMDIYFEQDWVFQVFDMACKTEEETKYLVGHMEPEKFENHITGVGDVESGKFQITIDEPSSEHILALWLIMNNMTQLNFDGMLAFVTLRTEHAEGYCSLTREGYTQLYPNSTQFLWDPDKMTSYLTSGHNNLDLDASYEKRCGNHTLHLHVKQTCLEFPGCGCNKPYGYLYMGANVDSR